MVVLTRQRELKGALGRVEAANGPAHSALDTALWFLCRLCESRQKSACRAPVFIRVPFPPPGSLLPDNPRVEVRDGLR
jgi:hypothetical protein